MLPIVYRRDYGMATSHHVAAGEPERDPTIASGSELTAMRRALSIAGDRLANGTAVVTL